MTHLAFSFPLALQSAPAPEVQGIELRDVGLGDAGLVRVRREDG